MSRTFIMGDVHGELAKLIVLLQRADLIDARLSWVGGHAHLWFMGDFFDRGPDGVGAVDLVMRLQREGAAAGGRVEALLGNHEPLILGALRFPDRASGGPGGCFLADWELNGGMRADLERLTPEHVAWLIARPAMALVGDTLLIHADGLFYGRYGDSIAQVNQALTALLQSDDVLAWDHLLGEFAERNAFADRPLRVESFLKRFGGQRIVHGHTPISYMTRQPPAEVIEPYTYAGGLCINVDAGLYRGSPGFLFGIHPAL